MPPRYAYWTILAGGLPTAFRAAEREELLPTFHRLREKHPDAEMKYFQHGKLWASREEAQNAVRERRERGNRPSPGSRAERRARPVGPERDKGSPGEPRGKTWRPGGEHRDPRQPFKDAQKEKNQERRRERWEHKQSRPPREKLHGEPLRREVKPESGPRPPEKREWSARPPRKNFRNPGKPSGPGHPPGPGSRERRPGGPPGPNRRRR